MTNLTGDRYFDQVVRENPFGWKYTNPMRSPYFWFEEVDHFFWPKFMGVKRHYAYYACVIYIAAIFGIQRFMKNRPAFELKGALFLWNFLLGVFSIMGFWRTIPGSLYVLRKEDGFYRSICVKEDLDIQGAYWVMMFVFSKYVELGDTIFIVLRKKPLIVLQWYHHLMTMSVTWIVAPFVEPIARWYCVMNFAVHSLMYPYFALRAVGVRIPTPIANLITTVQLTQMVVGLCVNILSVVYQQMGYPCFRDPLSIQLFTMVYGSFFILFAKLFYDSVISGRKRRSEKKVELKGKKME